MLPGFQYNDTFFVEATDNYTTLCSNRKCISALLCVLSMLIFLARLILFGDK